MLDVRTIFRPFRLKISRRAPVELAVTLENRGPGKALFSFDLSCDRGLSFDKGGFRNSESATLGDLGPGRKVERVFYVHAKPVTRQGSYEFNLRAMEHYQSYAMVQGEVKKKFSLIVEE